MKYTSAEAAKLLRTLNEEIAALKDKETRSAVYMASIEEDPKELRPEYDYDGVRAKLDALEAQIRAVKHVINVFNTTTEVPGFGMTIDQILIYIPQLSEKKRLLSSMASRLPKERANSGYGMHTVIEYSYANYDIAKAEADLKAVTDELARAQTALDVVNNSVQMEITL